MGRVYADEDDHVVVELTPEDILYRFVPDGNGGMLTRGAATEVLAGQNDVASGDFSDEIGIGVLHAVAGQFGRVRRVQVPCGDDGIGVHIVSELPDFSSNRHVQPHEAETSAGWAMRPTSALAAATAGDAR